MKQINYKLIGNRIKERRIDKNLTQEKLAEIVGIGVQHLSKIENGKASMSLQCFISIANALTTTTDYLLMNELIEAKQYLVGEANNFFSDCSPKELYILTETTKTLKQAIRSQEKE